MDEAKGTGRRMTDRYRNTRGTFALTMAAFLAATLTAYAYWPGLMSWDPVRQYGEAQTGIIDDWHPPMMQWIWRQAIRLYPGPAPMLLLQLGFYWGGLTLIGATMWISGRAILGAAMIACGLWPLGLALTGMIFKDCLMAGTLLLATGLLAAFQMNGSAALRIASASMLVLAATLRFNAFTACLPLLVMVLPFSWRRSWLRLVVTSAISTLILMTAMPVANRLIGAAPSGVALSLIIFDLGGITEHSGVNVFPEEMDVRDPVLANHRCYRPAKWDSYSDWVAPECPLGFTAWNDNLDPGDIRPYAFWAHAILAHPAAYAEHRLIHFAINTRIVPLTDAVERPVPAEGAPNQWNFHTTPNMVMRSIDAAAIAVAHTPLGWPITWIGLAIGAVIASWGLPTARLIVPIGLSSAFYGCGYAIFSVAAELRYHLWTEIGALLAVAMVVAEAKNINRPRIALALLPALFALLAGTLGRMMFVN